MINLTHVNIKFAEPVIADGDIAVPAGKITAITGPSGSGKTTLLYCLGLISSNKDYEYLFDGEQVNVSDDEMKGAVRKSRIGYIFQDKNLNDSLTVKENIRLMAICALAKDPDLIIADEPTSSLDAANTELVMSLFREIAYERGKMVVIATHDPVIYEQADVIYRIEGKKINAVKGAELLHCTVEDEASKKENGAD